MHEIMDTTHTCPVDRSNSTTSNIRLFGPSQPKGRTTATANDVADKASLVRLDSDHASEEACPGNTRSKASPPPTVTQRRSILKNPNQAPSSHHRSFYLASRFSCGPPKRAHFSLPGDDGDEHEDILDEDLFSNPTDHELDTTDWDSLSSEVSTSSTHTTIDGCDVSCGMQVTAMQGTSYRHAPAIQYPCWPPKEMGQGIDPERQNRLVTARKAPKLQTELLSAPRRVVARPFSCRPAGGLVGLQLQPASSTNIHHDGQRKSNHESVFPPMVPLRRALPLPNRSTEPDPHHHTQIEVTPGPRAADSRATVKELVEPYKPVPCLESEARLLRSGHDELLSGLGEAAECLSTSDHSHVRTAEVISREDGVQEMHQDRMRDIKKSKQKAGARPFSDKKLCSSSPAKMGLDRVRTELDKQSLVLDELRSNSALQRATLDDLEKERDGLRSDKAALLLRQKDLIAQIEALGSTQGKADALAQELAALGFVKAALEERIQKHENMTVTLTAERDSLKEEVQSHLSKIKSLAASADKFDDEKERLEARVFGLQEDKMGLQAKLAGAENEIEHLKTAIVKRSGETTRLEKQVQNMEVMKTELHNKIEDLIHERDGERLANVSLAGKVLEAEGKLAGAKQELDVAAVEVEALRTEKAGLEKVHDILKARVSELETHHVDVLYVTAAEAKERAKALQLEAGKVTDLATENAVLENKLADLQTELDGTAALKSVNTNLQTKLSTLQAELDNIAGPDRAALEDRHKAELEKTTAQLSGLSEQNAHLTAQVVHLQGALSAAATVVNTASFTSASASFSRKSDRAGAWSTPSSPTRVRSRSRTKSMPPMPKDAASSRKARAKKASIAVSGGNSTTSTSTKDDMDSRKSAERLVVVRERNDRGSLQIMKKCDLYLMRSRSVSSVHEH